jgi:hypothetical protein
MAEKAPPLQRNLLRLSYVLLGFAATGAFLDWINNAISIVTPKVTYIGTCCYVVVWLTAELISKVRGIQWKSSTGGSFRVKSLGVKLRLAMLGGILLLWIPRVIDRYSVPKSTSLTPSRKLIGGTAIETQPDEPVELDNKGEIKREVEELRQEVEKLGKMNREGNELILRLLTQLASQQQLMQQEIPLSVCHEITYTGPLSPRGWSV